MVEYWLGASARQSGFTEQTTVLQFPLEDLKGEFWAFAVYGKDNCRISM